jgi:cell division protease FtsH
VTRGAVALSELPKELTPFEAVAAAYPAELARCDEAIHRGLSVLVECDKGLVPYFYRSLRDRLKRDKIACLWIDGRPEPGQPTPPTATGLISTLIAQLRDAVRAAVDARVVVLPHLDLLTTTASGLTAEAREVIPLLYENPELLFIGFKDPSMPIPRVIERLFPHHESILGVQRDRLRHLVTEREARKFGAELNPFLLYKYVSGVHAVKLRKLLSAIRGEDLPADPHAAIDQLRAATLTSDLQVPDVDLDRDIGGYTEVKRQIRSEILDLLAGKDALVDAEEVARIEALLPRGIIFSGPPGTGKTLFAKGIASALGAAITVVSGPELKSKWVGESEERIRQIFTSARQAAPSVIVFDELDSFATARGTYTSSGVEHSMVNQLLTEMDGFRRNEMVFVIGTTNYGEALDPALLRPGRFEFNLEISFPDADDRRAILQVHERRLGLAFTGAGLDSAVRRSADRIAATNLPWTGDHLQALCRAIARDRVRTGRSDETTPEDVDRALEAHARHPPLDPREALARATHEAGHAVTALHCPESPRVDRVALRGDLGETFAALRAISQAQLSDAICSILGAREAEAALLGDLSVGCGEDLARAGRLAREVVERFGLAPTWSEDASDHAKVAFEAAVAHVLDEQRARAGGIVRQHLSEIEILRDGLLARDLVERG